MALSFATASDLESGWRPLTDAEVARADTLLSRASARIRQRFPSVDDRIAEGTLDPEIPLIVAVAMAQRAMSVTAEGVSQESQNAGPFAVNRQFSNPMGNLYLGADDIALLSESRVRRAFSVDLTPER